MSEAFGRYTLLQRIGTGGMAEVWKGQVLGPAGFAKTLAVKRILPDLAIDASFVQMFVDEAKLVADLVHPNIVQVFELGREGRDYFIAMEYVPGANVAALVSRLLEKEEKLDSRIALHIALETCKALGFAHTKTDGQGRLLRLVHRDISPHNILVSYGGDVKVTDFGIAKSAYAAQKTATGMVRGKLAYLSPEQAAGKEVDRRSDLFSLGLVLYEMITGQRVLVAEGMPQTLAMAAGFRGLSDAQLELIPPDCRGVLMRALRGSPDERFQTAVEMETALAAALGPRGGPEARSELATLVQRLFAAEYARDSSEGRSSQGSSSEVSGTLARGPVTVSGLQDRDETRTRMSAMPAAAHPPAPRARSWLAGVAVVAVAAAFGIGVGIERVQLPSRSPTVSASPGETSLGEEVSSPPPGVRTAAPSTAEMTPLAQASPRKPRPTHSAHPAATTAVALAPTPTATAPRPSTTVSVAAKPWVAVSIDGHQVAPETPLRNYQLPSGPHTFTFENHDRAFSMTRQIILPSQRKTQIFVDVTAGTITTD